MPRPPWACLLYVGAADSKIHDEVKANLEEMRRAHAEGGVPIAAQLDWGDDIGGQRGVMTPKGFRSEKVLKDPTSFNSGDVNVFREFLKWGTKRFKADRHMLVLLGHGYGVGDSLIATGQWKPRTDGSGKLVTQHGDRGLSVADLAETLRIVRGREHKLAVLGFNSCFMNAVELAYELRDYVEYVVGSQATMEVKGWAYHPILKQMARPIAPRALCMQIVSATAEKHRKNNVAVVMSALDLSKAAALGRHVKDLVAELSTAVADPRERQHIQDAMSEDARYDKFSRDFPDFRGFCLGLANRTQRHGVAEAALRVAAAVRYGDGPIKPVVYWKRDYKSRYQVRMGGLSIYFAPLPEGRLPEVQVPRERYEQLSFCRYTGWSKFMYGFEWVQQGVGGMSEKGPGDLAKVEVISEKGPGDSAKFKLLLEWAREGEATSERAAGWSGARVLSEKGPALAAIKFLSEKGPGLAEVLVLSEKGPRLAEVRFLT